MDLIVKVITQAGKAQDRLEAALDDAEIVRVPTTAPSFYLIAAEDLPRITAIAATFRAKPQIMQADEDDVPEAGRSAASTGSVVTLIHRAGYTFNWDEDTHEWCVSGLRDGFTDETADTPARNRRDAAFAALRHLVS